MSSDTMKGRTISLVVVLVIVVSGLGVLYAYGRSLWVPVYLQVVGKRTVAEVVSQFGPDALHRLRPAFQHAGVAYPPDQISLLAFKAENRLELWADQDGSPVFIKTYPIKAASGQAGPKLKEGDRQVPEGFYRIIALNPNSSYHLSMKLNYPNENDRRMARAENRTDLGGNIFIHGKAASIGCLAMGDTAIEELFVLVSEVGGSHSKVLIAPWDFRERPLPVPEKLDVTRPWVETRYRRLVQALEAFRHSRDDGIVESDDDDTRP